jgi:polyhydroxyalkanoate synthesis repressor PhaR
VERTQTAQVRLIKRYGNRKLYDVRSSRYVTLEGVRSLVQAGEDVRVIDNDSGEDLTGVTFAQIIYEETKRQNGIYSLPFLRWLIQRGDEAVRDVLRSVERGREALGNVREAAEKRVQKLVRGGGKGKRTLIEDLIELPQKRLDELQQRIDSQVRQSVQRVTKHPAFRTEIKRVERSIRELEDRLGQIGKRRAPAVKTRRKAKK